MNSLPDSRPVHDMMRGTYHGTVLVSHRVVVEYRAIPTVVISVQYRRSGSEPRLFASRFQGSTNAASRTMHKAKATDDEWLIVLLAGHKFQVAIIMQTSPSSFHLISSFSLSHQTICTSLITIRH